MMKKKKQDKKVVVFAILVLIAIGLQLTGNSIVPVPGNLATNTPNWFIDLDDGMQYFSRTSGGFNGPPFESFSGKTASYKESFCLSGQTGLSEQIYMNFDFRPYFQEKGVPVNKVWASQIVYPSISCTRGSVNINGGGINDPAYGCSHRVQGICFDLDVSATLTGGRFGFYVHPSELCKLEGNCQTCGNNEIEGTEECDGLLGVPDNFVEEVEDGNDLRHSFSCSNTCNVLESITEIEAPPIPPYGGTGVFSPVVVGGIALIIFVGIWYLGINKNSTMLEIITKKLK